MNNEPTQYGNAVLLQHLESGYYLSADNSFLPHNPSFYNLHLHKKVTPSCYFKFLSYYDHADRSSVDFGSEIKLVSAKLHTVVTMGEIVHVTF